MGRVLLAIITMVLEVGLAWEGPCKVLRPGVVPSTGRLGGVEARILAGVKYNVDAWMCIHVSGPSHASPPQDTLEE